MYETSIENICSKYMYIYIYTRIFAFAKEFNQKDIRISQTQLPFHLRVVFCRLKTSINSSWKSHSNSCRTHRCQSTTWFSLCLFWHSPWWTFEFFQFVLVLTFFFSMRSLETSPRDGFVYVFWRSTVMCRWVEGFGCFVAILGMIIWVSPSQ